MYGPDLLGELGAGTLTLRWADHVHIESGAGDLPLAAIHLAACAGSPGI